MMKLGKDRKTNIYAIFFWIPWHMNISENETADKEGGRKIMYSPLQLHTHTHPYTIQKCTCTITRSIRYTIRQDLNTLHNKAIFRWRPNSTLLTQDLRTSKNMYPLSNRRYFLMHFPFYNNERKIIIITTVYPQPQRKYLIQKVFITILTETSHYTSNTRRGRDLKKSLIRTKGKRPLQQSDRQHYISLINYNYKTYFHRPPSSEH